MQDRLGLVGFVDVVLVQRQGEAGFLQHGVLGEMDMLREMADGVAGGHGDRAGIGVLFVQDHAEERGFAVAVPADQPDPLARIDGKADAVEQELLAVGFFDVRDLEHSSSLNLPCSMKQNAILHMTTRQWQMFFTLACKASVVYSSRGMGKSVN